MSGPISRKTRYHDPYANLAAAILDSGVRCNDTIFLESAWASVLREICSLDDELYGDRDTNMRGHLKLSPNRGGNISE